MELFFDTETSDLYKYKLPYNDPTQPWIVQLGFILSTQDVIYQEGNLLIQANGRTISPGAQKVHGISVETAELAGLPQSTVLSMFHDFLLMADKIVCHNISFDANVLLANVYHDYSNVLLEKLTNKDYQYCTMLKGTPLCKLPGRYNSFKWPKLIELYKYLFNEEFEGAHDALADVRATRRCYYEMTK
jgi:DNA polymerase III epsilon subunit-like protein